MLENTFHRRILVVGKDETLCTQIRSILTAPREQAAGFDRSSPPRNGEATLTPPAIGYAIDSVARAPAVVNRLVEAREQGQPYSLAFVEVSSDSCADGLQSVRAVHESDPQLRVVLCIADAELSWPAIAEVFGICDWLLVLKQPFDRVAVEQLSCALTEKWLLDRRTSRHADELEQQVRLQAEELAAANDTMDAQRQLLADANDRLAQELSARQQADERIRHIAFHDALTGLPNRMLLVERIESCIERSRRQEGYCFAVLYCDLDNFKIVNDSLGHRMGDQLLVQVARKLNHSLRTSGSELRPAFDTVARLSGDEFVILLDEAPDVERVLTIAERVKNTIFEPIQVEENKLVLGISIGVAVSTGEYVNVVDLLRDADTALYHAKGNGKGCVSLFDQEMRAKASARLDLESDLRRAIEQNQFQVYYQPIVSLFSSEVVSVEALVRWAHPQRGIVLPDSFIPVAEETGLIDPIGALVIQAAVEQVADWRRTLPGREHLALNVNLSPRQLKHRDIVECVEGCLAQFQLDPRALCIEVTESAMANDSAKIRGVLERLVSRGVEVQLDDFGTGYSSLNILHTLPFSAVKLDRSFIGNLDDELENPTAVTAMMMLAQHENIKTVAEGIESHDQLTLLRELNCDFGQGYYFSRPLPADEIATYLLESGQRARHLPVESRQYAIS